MSSCAPRVSRAAGLVWRNGLWDLLLLALAFMIYSVVRQMSAGRQIEATYNAVDLVRIERALWMGHENALQGLILWNEALIRVFNMAYTYGHFWLIGFAAVWLFFRHRETYVLFRNAFFISGAIALVAFNLYPLAPPRLLPGEFGAVDTLRLFSEINYENAGFFVNEYAAIPSLHVGWNLLICLAIASCVRNPIVRFWAASMPLVMSATVVLTGNHWILDCIAGYVVGWAGLGLALLLRNEGWRVKQFVSQALKTPASA
jgi:membrane-associated phospholipid phosphatase